MSSSLIVALEFIAVVVVVLGLGVWELVRLRREQRRDASQRESAPPTRR